MSNRNKLFTFLDYDGVPWNNNNAESAIKAFAKYRKIADGTFTENGIKQYLILLSVYQTCRYKGIDFLKFMLSKETDIDRCGIPTAGGSASQRLFAQSPWLHEKVSM